MATGQPYLWQGAADARALKRLLAKVSPDEVRARWKLAIRAEGWKRCATIAQLGMKWNEFSSGRTPVGGDDERAAVFDRMSSSDGKEGLA